jgi:dihydrodipicolinate synthase/N-acetylneuraminate lyase
LRICTHATSAAGEFLKHLSISIYGAAQAGDLNMARALLVLWLPTWSYAGDKQLVMVIRPPVQKAERYWAAFIDVMLT